MKNYHLMITEDLHHRIKVHAARCGITIKDLIVRLLERELEEYQPKAKGKRHEDHRLSD